MSVLVGVAFVPGIVAELAQVVPEAVLGRCPRSRGVFPLGLGGQAVLVVAFFFIEFADKCLHIVPPD